MIQNKKYDLNIYMIYKKKMKIVNFLNFPQKFLL